MLEEIFKQLFYMLVLTVCGGLLLFMPLTIVMYSSMWMVSKYFLRIKWSDIAPSRDGQRFIYVGTAVSCLTWLFFIVRGL